MISYARRALSQLAPTPGVQGMELAKQIIDQLGTELTQAIEVFWSLMPDLEALAVAEVSASRTLSMHRSRISKPIGLST